MPEPTPLLRLQIPTGAEADDVPADLMELFTEMEKASVPKALNTADRDSRYSGATTGQLATGTDQEAVWYKNPAGQWVSRFTDTKWQQVTSFSNGWTSGQAIYYRVKDGICYWEGALRPPSGYIQDTDSFAFTVPSAALATPTPDRALSVLIVTFG